MSPHPNREHHSVSGWRCLVNLSFTVSGILVIVNLSQYWWTSNLSPCTLFKSSPENLSLNRPVALLPCYSGKWAPTTHNVLPQLYGSRVTRWYLATKPTSSYHKAYSPNTNATGADRNVSSSMSLFAIPTVSKLISARLYLWETNHTNDPLILAFRNFFLSSRAVLIHMWRIGQKVAGN